jgi:hypothetical protein
MASMIFSHRYHRALSSGRLTVELGDDFRRKLWTQLVKHNDSVGVQRDPDDRWIDNSTVIAEAAGELATEHGWFAFPQAPGNAEDGANLGNVCHLLLTSAEAPVVFDFVELAFRQMREAKGAAFKTKINGLFELHSCPWRFTDGEFFKLDSDFVGARLVDDAHAVLSSHSFEGAAQEFAKARQDAVSGEPKDAILYAAKSFESVLKVLVGVEHGNADLLIKTLINQGFFDDLPESARQSFGEQVLKTLPSLRNRFSGHGQGSAVVQVPAVYAELALQLAAAFHNFLIAKHLQRLPPPPAPPRSKAPSSFADLDDEIPF